MKNKEKRMCRRIVVISKSHLDEFKKNENSAAIVNLSHHRQAATIMTPPFFYLLTEWHTITLRFRT